MVWLARQLGKYREAVIMAFEAIKANKLRSALTVFGVLIGVTTVVAMMSIIEGLNLSIERDASFLSGPTFEVSTSPIVVGGGFGEDNPNFNLGDAEAIMEQCPNVALADIESFNTVICEYRGNKTTPISITSASTGYFDVLNEQYVGDGRIINRNDVNTARDVIVIGPDVAKTLFGTLDPIGRRIKVSGRSFTVIGVFDSKGEVFGTSWDNYVVIPETTFTK
ncbi:MAG: ABC transporter permease, partial [bacterium]|nr:ABC transporter permease [bacterium]